MPMTNPFNPPHSRRRSNLFKGTVTIAEPQPAEVCTVPSVREPGTKGLGLCPKCMKAKAYYFHVKSCKG